MSCTKISVGIWTSPSTQSRRDKVALTTTCVKRQIQDCQHKDSLSVCGCCVCYIENLNWAACGARVGYGCTRPILPTSLAPISLVTHTFRMHI